MRYYDTLLEAIKDLQSHGYTHDFNLKPHNTNDSSEIYSHPENFHIDQVYRFEGFSNPDDNSILFAISSNRGLKGLLVDAYGAYSSAISDELRKKLGRYF